MHALAELRDTCVNKLDATMGGPRLQPINAEVDYVQNRSSIVIIASEKLAQAAGA